VRRAWSTLRRRAVGQTRGQEAWSGKHAPATRKTQKSLRKKGPDTFSQVLGHAMVECRNGAGQGAGLKRTVSVRNLPLCIGQNRVRPRCNREWHRRQYSTLSFIKRPRKHRGKKKISRTTNTIHPCCEISSRTYGSVFLRQNGHLTWSHSSSFSSSNSSSLLNYSRNVRS
jgi:hypothetical protein